jgi:hypothetical protein
VVRMNLPIGPATSGKSQNKTSTPLSISVSRNFVLRVSRSSLATTSFALCRLQVAKAARSCWRFALRPLSTSTKSPTSPRAAVQSRLDGILLRR